MGQGVRLIQWTPELLTKAFDAYLDYGVRFDLSLLNTTAENAMEMFRMMSPYTLQLGDGGIIFASPIQPGIACVGHIYLWDPKYFRRPELIRASIRWFVRKFHLNRVTGMMPSRHRLSAKLAESVGFQREGLLRNAVLYNKDGEIALDDMLVYGLLAEEV